MLAVGYVANRPRALIAFNCMTPACDELPDCKARLEAARLAVEESSAQLKRLIFFGSEDALEAARVNLHIARERFTSAQADCWEICGA